tara:strand:- start:5086 stop:5610 length:525 start_codon:yes stop_codon:yes gene_type:complete
MNNEYINEITLKYLLNPAKINTNIENKNNMEKEIKFYKKRINQITKDMGKGEYPNNFIKSLYFEYATEIIYYLKNLDQKDILQEEYLDLSFKENCLENENKNLEENENGLENENKNLEENLNNLMIKPKEKANLNNFVKKINLDESEKIIPQKKKVNIKDAKFKTKGVKKNLNI